MDTGSGGISGKQWPLHGGIPPLGTSLDSFRLTQDFYIQKVNILNQHPQEFMYFMPDLLMFRRTYLFCTGLAYVLPSLRVSAASAAPPATTHPSIKESTKGGGRRRRLTPFVDAAEGRLLYGWVCGGWGGSRRGRNTQAWRTNKQVRRNISKSGKKKRKVR